MRRILAIEFMSLDGVIQSPGGPEEDTEGGFDLGGWIAPYSDSVLGKAIRERMGSPFDLLLGRKTYDIWAPYWPANGDAWPEANAATKYVASRTVTAGEWGPSAFLGSDTGGTLAALKETDGPDLHVYGSADLLQTLFALDLVDGLRLMIHPLTLGRGKRLFGGGPVSREWRLERSEVSTTGVILADYGRKR